MMRVSARQELMMRVSARQEVMTRVSASGSNAARRATLCLLIVAASCASPRVTLPSGAGTPFPDFVSAYTQATAECRTVRTMSASLSLSGRAGSTRLAARIDAGFAEPARLRLEGYPRVNFGGKPLFVLVASGPAATLVLTRDGRVLRGAAPSAIIEALAGVALEPDELRALVSGCALGAGQPSAGRSFGKGWAAVDTGDSTAFLRQLEGQWRVVAVRRGSLTIEYSNFAGGRPSTVHLQTTSAPGVAPADLTLRISQVEINTPLDDAVFNVDVPRDAVPLTLEELRRAGPLGGEGTEAAVPVAVVVAEETELTEQDHHGGAEITGTHGQEPGRTALCAVNREGDQKHKQPVSFSRRAACVSVLPLDSWCRPQAGTRPGAAAFSVFPPCLRVSVLSLSRDLRSLR
jgi:hypothetical protein